MGRHEIWRRVGAAWRCLAQGGPDSQTPSSARAPLRRAEYEARYAMRLRDWLLYHQREIVFGKATWRGTTVWKNPLDAWVYQEIIFEVRPDVVVEIGTRYGGSALFFADLLTLADKGVVISIDADHSECRIEHGRVQLLTGNSSDPAVIGQVREACAGRRVLVMQDGGHDADQALADLENYAPLVSVGSYFIMEDGIVDLFHDGDGLGFKTPGPLAAVETFLARHPEFEVDASKERYLLTYNPRGFLRRVS